MSEPSTPPSVDRPARRAWLAAVPFALAWLVAAGVLDGPLAPPRQGGPQIDEAPAAQPASAPATHHEDQVFDSTDLISV